MKKIVISLLDTTEIEFNLLKNVINKHSSEFRRNQSKSTLKLDDKENIAKVQNISINKEVVDKISNESSTFLESDSSIQSLEIPALMNQNMKNSLNRIFNESQDKNDNYFFVQRTPIVIQKDISSETTYLACHKPNLSQKYIYCLYKHIPIINILALYDIVPKVGLKYTELLLHLDLYKIEPLHGLTFFMEKNDEEVANYLYFLGGIRVDTLSIATDLFISYRSNKKDFNLDRIQEHFEYEKLPKTTVLVDSTKVFENNWQIYQRKEQFLCLTAENHDVIDQRSDINDSIADTRDYSSVIGSSLISNSRVFANKLFFLSPQIPKIFHPALIKLIHDNGGIRTTRDVKNVDFRLKISSFTALEFKESEKEENLDKNSSQKTGTQGISKSSSTFLSLDYFFQSIKAQHALISNTFLLREVKIKRPLKEVTILIRINKVCNRLRYEKLQLSNMNMQENQNNDQTFGNENIYLEIVNKIHAMGARLKKKFDSSVTHIITENPTLSSFENLAQSDNNSTKKKLNVKPNCIFVNLDWVNRCLRARTQVKNSLFWQKHSRNSISYENPIANNLNLKFPTVCFTNTPTTLKNRLTEYLESYKIYTTSIDQAQFLIVGNLTLCEKVLLAMVDNICILKAVDYQLDDYFDIPTEIIQAGQNPNQKFEQSPESIGKALSFYNFTAEDAQTDKQKKIIAAFYHWKDKKPFKNWRILIVQESDSKNDSGKKNVQSSNKGELTLLLHKIIIKGGGLFSYTTKNFSYTHKIDLRSGLNWIVKHLLNCGVSNNN
ncbi:rad-4 protein like [Pseudoloma neurophilia]|uniref:Rad-4 protein like n=1 Tax=Pseudoloma neurophilia TaxID=146866 RepID=A0A0R0M2A5_9MICR|nr:rad-4 protein like [Pseudoloma neurophilia]